jgi:hypothetical protein
MGPLQAFSQWSRIGHFLRAWKTSDHDEACVSKAARMSRPGPSSALGLSARSGLSGVEAHSLEEVPLDHKAIRPISHHPRKSSSPGALIRFLSAEVGEGS